MTRQLSAVFVKLVAPDKLLLSENVCRMLGIVSHLPNVHVADNSEVDSIVDNPVLNKSELRDEQGAVKPNNNIVAEEPTVSGSSKPQDGQSMKRVVDALPVAVVKLLNAVYLPAYHSAVFPVQVKGVQGSVLIEQSKPSGLRIVQSLVETKKDGITTLCITNHSKIIPANYNWYPDSRSL